MSDSTPTSGSYPENILEQPGAVRATVAGLPLLDGLSSFGQALTSGQFRHVVLTGMGASYAALHPLTLQLQAQGIPSQRIETSELLYHSARLLGPQTLLVAASQSGASAEILRLLERTRQDHITTIAVTNTPDSPLSRSSDALVLTRAGAEYSVSSKTYVATLTALNLLGDALCGRNLAPARAQLGHAADAMENYLSHTEEFVAILVQALGPIQHLVLVGRGASLAAVGAGALIIQEAAKFPCLGMSSAAFRHGPMELISPDLFVLVLNGTLPTQQLNARLAADIRALGANSALVEESLGINVFALPPVAPVTLPLLEILVPEMLSLALARLRNHVPGEFGIGSKVTVTE